MFVLLPLSQVQATRCPKGGQVGTALHRDSHWWDKAAEEGELQLKYVVWPLPSGLSVLADLGHEWHVCTWCTVPVTAMYVCSVSGAHVCTLRLSGHVWTAWVKGRCCVASTWSDVDLKECKLLWKSLLQTFPHLLGISQLRTYIHLCYTIVIQCIMSLRAFRIAVVTEVYGVLVHVLSPCQCSVECSVSLRPQSGWLPDAISVSFMGLQVADGDDRYPGKSRVVQLLDNFKIHGPNGTRILFWLNMQQHGARLVVDLQF